MGVGLVEDHFFSSNFSESGCHTLWAVNLCIPVGLPGVFLACSGLHLLLNQSEKKPQTYKLFNMRHSVDKFPMRLFFTFGDNKKQKVWNAASLTSQQQIIEIGHQRNQVLQKSLKQFTEISIFISNLNMECRSFITDMICNLFGSSLRLHFSTFPCLLFSLMT